MGNVAGFNAVTSHYPDRKRAIVVLTNLPNNKDRAMPADELAN
jgi:hypothetical protein